MILKLGIFLPILLLHQHATTSEAKPSARELKPRLLDRIRTLQATELSPLAADAYGHLLEICLDGQGEANPRVTCTEGYGYAADYVANQMREMGLTPLGNVEQTEYFQVVAGSVHETLCPPGIKNIIGMVPGSMYPDEYVVYSAHLDGPNNANPQTETTRGNGETSNAYDDGLAVAVGLAMAKQLMENPPKRSVIIHIDDGEEGWDDLGEKAIGETGWDVCRRYQNTDWYKEMYEVTGGPTGRRDRCPWYLIGTNYWVLNPTVDLANIAMMYVIDPLGSPFGSTTNALAILGGEQTNYARGGTLNEFIDDVWPSDSSVQTFKAPRFAVNGFGSSMDGYQRNKYQTLCVDSTQGCLSDGGIPGVWIAQPAFQKYHGGAIINSIKDMFGRISGSGTLPSPAYFQEDNLSAFYLPNLDATVTALHDVVRNTANNDDVTGLSYNRDRGENIDKPILRNLIEILDIIIDQLPDYPSNAAARVGGVVIPMRVTAAVLLSFGLNSSEGQNTANLIAQAAVGFSVAADFFYDGYVANEKFLDQSVLSQNNNMDAEPFAPTKEPTDQEDTTMPPTTSPTDVVARTPTGSPTITVVDTANPTTQPTLRSPSPSTLSPSGTTSSVPTDAPDIATVPPSLISTEPLTDSPSLGPTMLPAATVPPSLTSTKPPTDSPSLGPTMLPSAKQDPTRKPAFVEETSSPTESPSATEDSSTSSPSAETTYKPTASIPESERASAILGTSDTYRLSFYTVPTAISFSLGALLLL